jgi:tRNA A-37 threonylcarbamoyl transferase component Bud32
MNMNWGHRGTAGPTVAPGEFAQCSDFHDEAAALSYLSPLFAGRFLPLRCEIFNVWYMPAKSFHVVYELYDAQGRLEVLTLQFFSGGESRAQFETARTQAERPDLVHHVPDWDAVAWVFPCDARLSALPHMVQPEGIAARLAGSGVAVGNAASLRWTLLSYLPGNRCALRYRWAGEEAGVVAKLQANAAASHGAMLGLWQMPGRHFGMAPPLGCDAALGMRWERFVPGHRIEELAPQIGLENAFVELMRGLVQLHRTPVPNLPLQRAREVMIRLEKKVLRRIRDSLGPLSAECDAFAADLGAEMERLPQRPLVTVHGDLHTANILITDAGPVLIDLDSLAQGEPAFDLALLGSRLLLVALNGEDGELTHIAEVVARLPEIYEAAGGDPVPREVFAWFMAALFVGRQIKTCIRHLAPSLRWISPVLLRIGQITLQRRAFDAGVMREALAARRS